jgi:multicomponent Na+:H+ antiporter subunit E
MLCHGIILESMKHGLIYMVRMLPAAVVLTAVWCIWSESFSPGTLLTGAVVGFGVLILTDRLFLKQPYHMRYRFSVIRILRYLLVLTAEIFRSGIHAMHITLKDRIHIGVVDLPTRIEDPLLGVMVATAITLTPGTVTIDYSPGRFKVVWIDCVTSDPDEAAELIKGRFERVLAGQKAAKESVG